MLRVGSGIWEEVWDRACCYPRGILLPVRCQKCRQRDLSSQLYEAQAEPEKAEAEAE